MQQAVNFKPVQRLVEPFAVAGVLVLLLFSCYVTFSNTRRLRAQTDLVEESYKFLSKLGKIEASMTTAEANQRGYVITGQDLYLDPYHRELGKVIGLLASIDNSQTNSEAVLDSIITIRRAIDDKIAEMETSIQMRREGSFELALAMVSTNVGKDTMDEIVASLASIRKIEEAVINERELKAATIYWRALLNELLSTAIGLTLVLSVIYLIQHNRRKVEQFSNTLQLERDEMQRALDRANRLETDNQRMAQYNRNFLEQIEDYAIFAMDSECRATTWNRGVFNVLGFEEEAFIGKDIKSLIFTPEAIAMGIPDHEFAVAASEGRASDDRWMLRRDGNRFWASGITSAIKDEAGNLIGYSKVMRNLTERKRDQDEMAELAARLSEADRRKNEFLATLAHELRNPLAPIKNAVELMGMSEQTEENEELRQTMARHIEQIIRLIDDLLDVSRIGRGKIQLKPEVVDLRAVVAEAVEASNTFIAEKKQNLVVDLGDEPLIARIDPARITQVVSNLLNNSCRYSDSGCDIAIRVENYAKESGQRWAKIIVKDNGIGISKDRIDDIFQMFSQIHDSLQRGNAGLGIGLTLVKNLVEVHGGVVQADSEGLGKGSTFIVELPLAGLTDEALNTHVDPEPFCNTKSFRVLVVEDMRALRTIMARLLVKLGHEVEVAEDGLHALEQLTQFKPEIIFSDISMPGMTGYDLARKLRSNQQTASVYLVAMTGYGQQADRDLASDSGFDEHMVKPVNINKLQDLFDRLSRPKDI